jgi:hypothetical protein
VFERRPLPPEPPDLPPPKPELWCTVLRLYQAAYEQRRPGLAAPRREQAAKQLALWCEHSAQAYRCTPEEMAGRVISGLFASERAAEARWPLGYAAHDPEEYAGDLPGAPAVLRPQAKRYAGMSRVPTPEEYAAAANEEDPW